MIADSVEIAIENGGAVPGTFQQKACITATTAFDPRSVGDTFIVTVTAPPGMAISRVTYLHPPERPMGVEDPGLFGIEDDVATRETRRSTNADQ